MTLSTKEAEHILTSRLDSSIQSTKKVIGFAAGKGKVLALNLERKEASLWFQSPPLPDIDGVSLADKVFNGTSNLSGPLLPLKESSTHRVEVDSADALHRFLDWYTGSKAAFSAGSDTSPRISIDFNTAYDRFQELMKKESGYPFKGFDEGLAAVWEDYKPRLRDHALDLLGSAEWLESDIGSGKILERMIDAIEIQDNRKNLINNLVFWQNRYGHANRDHRIFLAATSNPKLRRDIETLLYGLYRGEVDEGETFDHLSEQTGRKYPLLAYLYFLKDMDRFTPIQPTGFDRAFNELDIDLTTRGQCSWENYVAFNEALEGLRPLIASTASLENVRLIDAHSFCWIFATLLKKEAEGDFEKATTKSDSGRVLGEREKSIITMCRSVEETVRNANGQTVERALKNKELKMTSLQLEKLIATLLDIQENRCALTGLRFHFQGPHADNNLLPSLDRIDSNGHYEEGNLQVVCRFINFWKSDSDNEEFKRLLMLVRGMEAEG